MIRSFAAMMFCIFAAPALAEPTCFDLAVIAKSPRYKWLPIASAHDPGDIILSRPVRVSFDVEQNLIGSFFLDKIQVETILHTEYNRQIRHFLLFLKKRPDGRLSLVRLQPYVVQLSNGNYALPLIEPMEENDLQPEGFISLDYQDRITKLHYAASEAWWLDSDRKSLDDQQQLTQDYPWLEFKRGRVTAPRGLDARSLIDLTRTRRCPQQ